MKTDDCDSGGTSVDLGVYAVILSTLCVVKPLPDPRVHPQRSAFSSLGTLFPIEDAINHEPALGRHASVTWPTLMLLVTKGRHTTFRLASLSCIRRTLRWSPRQKSPSFSWHQRAPSTPSTRRSRRVVA
jgi:hypothetical protein